MRTENAVVSTAPTDNGQRPAPVADPRQSTGASRPMSDPKLPHSYHNPGPGDAITLWVMSPPGY